MGGEMDEWVDGYLFYLRGLNSPNPSDSTFFTASPEMYQKCEVLHAPLCQLLLALHGPQADLPSRTCLLGSSHLPY